MESTILALGISIIFIFLLAFSLFFPIIYNQEQEKNIVIIKKNPNLDKYNLIKGDFPEVGRINFDDIISNSISIEGNDNNVQECENTCNMLDDCIGFFVDYDNDQCHYYSSLHIDSPESISYPHSKPNLFVNNFSNLIFEDYFYLDRFGTPYIRKYINRNNYFKKGKIYKLDFVPNYFESQSLTKGIYSNVKPIGNSFDEIIDNSPPSQVYIHEIEGELKIPLHIETEENLYMVYF